MSDEKRHHYLPEFYLQGFCRDRRLWVYDDYTSKVRRDVPKNVAVENFYYSVRTEKSPKDPLANHLNRETVSVLGVVANARPVT